MPKSVRLLGAIALVGTAAGAAEQVAPVTRVSVERRAEFTFAKADTNHDGYLSKDEYRAAILAVAKRYDAKVTDAGRAAADAQFDAIDRAHSGRIARAVFVEAATAHFDGADLNGDGTVTPEEARKAAKIKQKALKDAHGTAQ